MTSEISKERAIEIISDGFWPLRCVAEERHVHKHMGFCVFDANGVPALRIAKITAMDYGKRKNLQYTVERARGMLARDGIRLASWQMPEN